MPFQNILIPTDLSSSEEKAVQQALALAARMQATVLLLHVLPGVAMSGHEETMQANVEQRLRAVARQAEAPVHTCVVWGTPAAEICRVATEQHSDLIAMSTHGRTGMALDHIGSVADAVIRQAPCAVLILRPSRAGEEGT